MGESVSFIIYAAILISPRAPTKPSTRKPARLTTIIIALLYLGDADDVHALPNQDKRAGRTDQHSLDKLMELAKMVKQESRKVENLKQVYITWVRVPWEGCNVTAN